MGVKHVIELEDLENFIYKWNIDYPIDRYYRKKYNIRFNSPEHRVCCFIDMVIEYLEDRLFILESEAVYVPGSGEFLKERLGDDIDDEQLMEFYGRQED